MFKHKCLWKDTYLILLMQCAEKNNTASQSEGIYRCKHDKHALKPFWGSQVHWCLNAPAEWWYSIGCLGWKEMAETTCSLGDWELQTKGLTWPPTTITNVDIKISTAKLSCFFHRLAERDCLPPLLLPFWFRSDESPAAQAHSYNLSNPLSARCDNVISSSSLFRRWLVSDNLYRLPPAWWNAWIRVRMLPVCVCFFLSWGCHFLEPKAASGKKGKRSQF